jgi:hypothetical protein
MRARIPQLGRLRVMALTDIGIRTTDQIIDAKTEDLLKAKGMTERLVFQAKAYLDSPVKAPSLRTCGKQKAIASALGRNPKLIERLYDERGDVLSRTVNEVLRDHLGCSSAFIGDTSSHEVDILIETEEGEIVVEVKRSEAHKISARLAEEVIGKGSKHKPIAYVTIGYPDFSDDAIGNCATTGITLIPIYVLGDILVNFWQNKLQSEDVLAIFKSRRYVRDLNEFLSA